MGVTGLWSVVSPTARPTSLASLNRKRLAVDASIWIYQFLKAVRDKEGNALRNSHVVGFFRRICKLLYFGIKPVFVFDGGAPGLKRETVRKRRQRREGRREDAVRTAGRLLAVQMERVVQEERERAQQGRSEEQQEEEEGIGDEGELVYVDEIGMDKTQRQKGRAEGFKRRDQYHLPDLDVRIEDMGAPNDPRIMSQAELEEYARQFHSGEDINLYDFSKIDFESPFFLSLPVGDRYNILNAARLRSRLRMGYTKDQLNGMFPDRMAFSKFQIERVRERNELTQRLMHINNGMGDSWDAGGRIAGEKGKEYVLVRNEGAEGGWALGVVSNKLGTSKGMAIDVDEESDDENFKSEEESDEFEDVEIEGLNRLPQSWKRKRAREVDYDVSYEEAAERIANKRRAVYDARKAAAQASVVKSAEVAPAGDEQDTLFVPQEQVDDDDDLFEDVDIGQIRDEDEDDDLQRAIAMSLDQPHEQTEAPPQDQHKVAEEEEDAFDMRSALAESRKSKHQSKTNVRPASPKPAVDTSKFSGPLPFESINLGQSLLGKKKAKQVEEDMAGGFDRELGDDAFRKERPPQPMPSWFDAAPTTKDMKRIREMNEDEDGEDHIVFGAEDRSRRDILQRKPTKEVIDLEAEPSMQQPSQIEVSSDEEEFEEVTQDAEPDPDEWQLPEHEEERVNAQEELRRKAEEEAREARYAMAREIAGEPEAPVEEPVEEPLSMNDVAERVQEKPPSPTEEPLFIPSPKRSNGPFGGQESDESVEWSASEHGSPIRETATPSRPAVVEAEESDDEFEDVPMNDIRPPALEHQPSTNEAPPALDSSKYLLPAEDEPAADAEGPAQGDQFEDNYSDSDEELMRQLAIEVEEHARFTNSLNSSSNKTKEEAARDYENELKQLRSQQKRDRRDADEVTQTMIQECQALLRLFGLPYITAPMEAEAQCAEMVTLGLVDGIITDDSDIFLFGGTRVYKNMFSQNKFVECYLLSDLEREYTLTRQKLISFAHLLGSDYTTGLASIGPVTALEILTDFPTLNDFRDWCSNVQTAHRPADLEGLLTTAFRRKFKKAAQKRLTLPMAFPDPRVDDAYLHPEVDSDPEQFQWGIPDLDKLRSFLMATIGWSQERTDEVLVPVIRDMNRRDVEGTQANITRFFSGGVGVGASARGPGRGQRGEGEEAMGQRNRTDKESGRMRNAWKRLRGEAEKQRRGGEDQTVGVESGVPAEEVGEDVNVQARVALTEVNGGAKATGRARKEKKAQRSESQSMYEADEDAADDESFEPQQAEKRPAKKTRGRRKADSSAA